MKTSDSLTKIAPALTKALAEIKNPEMTGTNPHFRKPYATLSHITCEIRPILEKHGLCILQDTAEGPTVSTRIMHSSGEWIESEPLLMTPDKGGPHGTMAAITYARRGSLCAILSITGDTDDDGNSAQGDKPQTPPAARQGPPAGSSRLISEKQAKFLYVLCGKKSSDPDGTRKAILEKTGVKKFEELPYDTGKKLIDDMAGRPDIEGGYGGPSDKDMDLDSVPF